VGVSPTATTCTVVIPCFNEGGRLDTETFAALAATPGIDLLFVNDGSTDATPLLLDQLASDCEAVGVEHLPTNQGKAEAVRRGLARALDTDVAMVAYFDADLATPVSELCRLIDMLAAYREQGSPINGIIASRVLLLGRRIERRRSRHYLGRAFATMAAVALGAQVYDTQCGAKVFVATDNLRNAVSARFTSRWAFDIELLGRLAAGDPTALSPQPTIIEEPLLAWSDVPGSTLSARSMLRSGLDVMAMTVRRLAKRLRLNPGHRPAA